MPFSSYNPRIKGGGGVKAVIAMDQKTKETSRQIRLAMVGQTKAGSTNGQNSWPINKAKYTAWESFVAELNEMGQNGRAVADIEEKWLGLKLSKVKSRQP